MRIERLSVRNQRLFHGPTVATCLPPNPHPIGSPCQHGNHHHYHRSIIHSLLIFCCSALRSLCLLHYLSTRSRRWALWRSYLLIFTVGVFIVSTMLHGFLRTDSSFLILNHNSSWTGEAWKVSGESARFSQGLQSDTGKKFPEISDRIGHSYDLSAVPCLSGWLSWSSGGTLEALLVLKEDTRFAHQTP